MQQHRWVLKSCEDPPSMWERLINTCRKRGYSTLEHFLKACCVKTLKLSTIMWNHHYQKVSTWLPGKQEEVSYRRRESRDWGDRKQDRRENRHRDSRKYRTRQGERWDKELQRTSLRWGGNIGDWRREGGRELGPRGRDGRTEAGLGESDCVGHSFLLFIALRASP